VNLTAGKYLKFIQQHFTLVMKFKKAGMSRKKADFSVINRDKNSHVQPLLMELGVIVKMRGKGIAFNLSTINHCIVLL